MLTLLWNTDSSLSYVGLLACVFCCLMRRTLRSSDQPTRISLNLFKYEFILFEREIGIIMQCLRQGLTSTLCRALLCSYLCWKCISGYVVGPYSSILCVGSSSSCDLIVYHGITAFHLQLMSSQLAMEINH